MSMLNSYNDYPDLCIQQVIFAEKPVNECDGTNENNGK